MKMFLGDRARALFKALDRVPEYPEGYVIIEDANGRKLRIPREGTLTDAINLRASECRNIFVIRDGDLTIDKEEEFYTSVTDRLVGLRAEEINEIKGILVKKVGLTPKELRFKKAIRDRMNKAREIIKKISELEKRVEEENLDEMEEQLYKYRETLEEIKEKLNKLHQAKRREDYEIGTTALSRVEEIIKELKQLEVYNDEDLRSWERSEDYIEEHENICKNLERELSDKQARLEKEEKDIKKEEEEYYLMKGKLEEALKTKSDVEKYIDELGKLKEQAWKKKALPKMQTILLVAVLATLFMHIVFSGNSLILMLTAIFTAFFIILLIVGLQFLYEQSKLEAFFTKIKARLAGLGIRAETPEDIIHELQCFIDRYHRLDERRRKMELSINRLKEKIEELNNRLQDERENIRRQRKNIERIKEKSDVDSLQEYRKRLEYKRELEKELKEKEGILRGVLGEPEGDTLEKKILFWRKGLKTLEKYKDMALDVNYDEEEMQRLKSEESEYEAEIERIASSINALREQLRDIEREANNVLQKSFVCESIADLKMLKDELESFVENLERKRECALKILEVLDKISAEERQRISKLFEEDAPVSKHFSEITAGLYDEVMLEDGKVIVKRKDGIKLTPKELSGGAYDQLYFSIRLALGEKILKGETGFFILDDPFIRADAKRLRKQIEMLKKISALGWQIILFTARDEIRELLKRDIEEGRINYIELPPLMSTIRKQ